MNKPAVMPPEWKLSSTSAKGEPHQRPAFGLRSAKDEMSRVLGIVPLHVAPDPAGNAIAHWRHGALHDVVKPMNDHVLMTYTGAMQRLERRSGTAVAIGTARLGAVTIIPAGSSARWDIPGSVDVIQLYLPNKTLQRVAAEAGRAAVDELQDRTGYPDPTTSRLLISSKDALEHHDALNTLFRQQLTDVLATRLLVAHTGSSNGYQSAYGGLSPSAMRRAIERLRSNDNADVSLGALAADAGLSRFHFCRAFRDSTGLSPHAWLRQIQLERAMDLLRHTDDSVVSIAVALGYASQTAFAAAFRRLTGETPTDWRKRTRV